MRMMLPQPTRSGPLERIVSLQVLRSKAGVLCNARQHSWADLLAVVEGEHIIGVALAPERAMRARLPFDLPPDSEQRL